MAHLYPRFKMHWQKLPIEHPVPPVSFRSLGCCFCRNRKRTCEKSTFLCCFDWKDGGIDVLGFPLVYKERVRNCDDLTIEKDSRVSGVSSKSDIFFV